jgi:hypothetical protein
VQAGRDRTRANEVLELSGEAKGFFSGDARPISGQRKESSRDKSIQLQKRRLSPLVVEEHTHDCRGPHFGERRGAEPFRAGKA